MKIYLVGIGMEGDRTLTRKAMQAVAEAELLIGAKRMLQPFSASGKATFCSYKAEEITARLRSGTEQCAAVLLSGDCGFFSGAEQLLHLLEGEAVEVISGISAPVYLCAKTGLSWERMRFISLHGTDNSIAVHVRSHPYCCFLLGGTITAALLCERLCEFGLGEARVYIGEHLGYEKERILTGKAAEFLHHPAETLCVVIVGNPAYCACLPTGIPDAEFVRSEIPMTKAEVRCIAVSALNIRANDTCWDIGCGTGSVSVEMALRCPDGMVFSIDKHPGAVRLTIENSRRFACDNISVSEGVCPEALTGLPAPDKVFIGGCSGKMAEVFSMIYDKNPAAEIVITAVSIETLNEAVTAFSAYGTECSITQLAVTRTRKVGTHTMLMAQNPVFLIKGALTCEGS